MRRNFPKRMHVGRCRVSIWPGRGAGYHVFVERPGNPNVSRPARTLASARKKAAAEMRRLSRLGDC